MPKTGRKRKKAEKAKTGLKTSLKGQKTKPVKLGKGHNEVKLDTKIKTLILPGSKLTEAEKAKEIQELKQAKEEGAKRLKPIKDLLAKLSHHANAYRQDGVKGLKDWVKFRPRELETQLAVVLQRSMVLLCDQEKTVRKDFCDFFGLLLETMPANATEAFHQPICAHLCCALSHIDQDIQRGSLLFLDELISRAPRILLSCYPQVLPACIEQIIQKSSSASGSSKILSTSVNSKIEVNQWRVNVFTRLENILTVLQREKEDIEIVEEVEARTYQENIGLYQDEIGGLSMADLRQGKQASRHASDEFSLENFGLKLSTILMDTWIEVAPSMTGKKNSDSDSKKPGNALNVDSALVLSKLISIIKLLLDLCETEKSKGSILRPQVQTYALKLNNMS